MARTEFQSNRGYQPISFRRRRLGHAVQHAVEHAVAGNWRALSSLVGSPRVLCLILVVASTGCLDTGQSHHLPAPLRDDFPYELRFQGSKVWDPDQFEIDLDGELHRIVLAGCEMPAVNHPQRQLAIDTLRDLVGYSTGRAVVQGRDRFQCEIAQVFVAPPADQKDRYPSLANAPEPDPANEVDVGLRLIELGLAGCLSTESGLSEEYQRAEKSAQAEQRGIWKVE